MKSEHSFKILFFINSNSGKQNRNWEEEIDAFFRDKIHFIEKFHLEKDFTPQEILQKIEQSNPDRVVAVGGDGTLNVVAQSLILKNIPLGIVPAGSANGMAKEFDITDDASEVFNTLISTEIKEIHVVCINEKLSIHLSDVGFNARMIEKFQSQDVRGLWGYLKATWKVAKNGWFKNNVQLNMTLDDSKVSLKAGMVVIANAKKYGSGAVINPTGDLEDDVFEIIVIKKVSVIELFKMMISHSQFNPHKIEVYKTKKLHMNLPRRNHFQIDGEYMGKVTEIDANIIPNALKILVPKDINSENKL